MRKRFLFIILTIISTNTINAQTRGNKVGYIDMEYILENVPNYIEAKAQLEQKAQKWKQEIEAKKLEINKLNDALKAEKPLLTAELIEERESEIAFLETEKLDYQQKRFGPSGDLILQKEGLVKPIQDQIFTAVQDIAEAKKYDFIFDKSSHLTILFAAKRFDISDQVIRILNRTEKREQLTKKQLKEEEDKENKEDAIDENPVLAEREKALQDKKTAREKLIADKKQAQEETKRKYEEKRKQLLAEREAKKNGTVVATSKTTTETKTVVDPKNEPQTTTEATKTTEVLKPNLQEERKKALEEKRKKILEEREATKKALEEKRLKELEEKEALKKANEEKLKENNNK
ncbi:OmpH family outer membrane protein [Flavobacterium sp. N3904]|uniref:OmpH family outer membrane protein n=1 Tax=Flavobacterium sp. N3904 TaxID=2986835 RepID=UPI0022248E63|nr:OmpH family outer membrane protein [Flavobacterium sp. N3904]